MTPVPVLFFQTTPNSAVSRCRSVARGCRQVAPGHRAASGDDADNDPDSIARNDRAVVVRPLPTLSIGLFGGLIRARQTRWLRPTLAVVLLAWTLKLPSVLTDDTAPACAALAVVLGGFAVVRRRVVQAQPIAELSAAKPAVGVGSRETENRADLGQV